LATEQNNVIWQFTQRGFGAEVCLLLQAWLYCLDNDLQFHLSSKYSNIAYQMGWQDYFEPFCQEIDHWTLKFELRRAKHWFRKWMVKRIQEYCVGFHFLNCPDIMFKFHSQSFLGKRFRLPQFGMVEGSAYDACRVLFKRAYRLNKFTRVAVEKTVGTLALPKEGYAAVHIRRGDKSKEAPLIPLEGYLAKVRALHPSVRHLFLMTDDFQVVETIRENYQEWVVHTLCKPSSRGHLQREFNRKSRAERHAETLQLISEIEIATRALFYVGTCSSNIAKLIGVCKSPDFVHGVDGEAVTDFWLGVRSNSVTSTNGSAKVSLLKTS